MKKILALMLAVCVVAGCAACVKDDKEVAENKTAVNSENGGEGVPSENSNKGEVEAGISTESKKVADENTTTEKKSGFNFVPEPVKIKPVKPVKPVDAKFDFDVKDFEANLAENLSEAELAKTSGMSIEEKKAILEKKQGMLKSLASGFKSQNVDVMINETSGEIVMDSSILFENDKADVSDSGKDFLVKFATAYASVICNENYKGFISKVVIEGHTDTNGSYDYNMDLSEKRADNVREIFLSDDVKLSEEFKSVLSQKLDSVGCSYDRPVVDTNGNVDMDASRRVTFRFMINVR